MNINTLNALIPESFEYTDTLTEQTGTINLKLRRMSFGIAKKDEFRTAMDESDTGAICKMLAELVAEWDLDADGEAFPPTAENLELLPVEFITVLSEKVFTRLFPNQKPADPSPNGSEPAESLSQGQAAS